MPESHQQKLVSTSPTNTSLVVNISNILSIIGNSSPEYSIVRKDRMSNKGRGLASLIHNTIQYSVALPPAPTAQDNVMEAQAVSIVSVFTIVLLLNIYIPPTTSCPSGYSASIGHLLTAHNFIIMCDFNAHRSLWHCTLEEIPRGTNLADQMGMKIFPPELHPLLAAFFYFCL